MSYALGLGAGRPRPACLVAFSGFMPTVPGFELDLSPPLPRFAVGHGTADAVISVEWGRYARARLEAADADLVYREAPHMGHSIDPVLLRELPHWVADTLRRAA
jgi:predicted esterase